jgi:hypothetical protein
MDRNSLIDETARVIYTDSYTQYGTCSSKHWKRTSETQRDFCRGQARAVLDFLASLGVLRTHGPIP